MVENSLELCLRLTLDLCKVVAAWPQDITVCMPHPRFMPPHITFRGRRRPRLRLHTTHRSLTPVLLWFFLLLSHFNPPHSGVLRCRLPSGSRPWLGPTCLRSQATVLLSHFLLAPMLGTQTQRLPVFPVWSLLRLYAQVATTPFGPHLSRRPRLRRHRPWRKRQVVVQMAVVQTMTIVTNAPNYYSVIRSTTFFLRFFTKLACRQLKMALCLHCYVYAILLVLHVLMMIQSFR